MRDKLMWIGVLLLLIASVGFAYSVLTDTDSEIRSEIRGEIHMEEASEVETDDGALVQPSCDHGHECECPAIAGSSDCETIERILWHTHDQQTEEAEAVHQAQGAAGVDQQRSTGTLNIPGHDHGHRGIQTGRFAGACS